MIFEGSCDTEDWSNDTENTALHLLFVIVIFHYYYFYCNFD